MVASKKLKAVQRQQSKLMKQSTPVANAWNSTQLRYGDHAALAADDKELKALRNNQWSVHGTFKMGFSRMQASLQPSCRTQDSCLRSHRISWFMFFFFVFSGGLRCPPEPCPMGGVWHEKNCPWPLVRGEGKKESMASCGGGGCGKNKKNILRSWQLGMVQLTSCLSSQRIKTNVFS